MLAHSQSPTQLSVCLSLATRPYTHIELSQDWIHNSVVQSLTSATILGPWQSTAHIVFIRT
ncbi:hypothetical protein PanWU01x14_201970 [Parasponia andersonii]|uniref:Uncharacterized protein n=1 Tax=Parasponia andersonii TaxID=3476 RepID=A0A2P5BXF1_PARAD|nr:hypothetical protein PanWU01x14_201970 [Parasponia andersonii]